MTVDPLMYISKSSVVTDFSFRSTAIGIPFAAEEDAVTVYNCSAASRYYPTFRIIARVWILAETYLLAPGLWRLGPRLG